MRTDPRLATAIAVLAMLAFGGCRADAPAATQPAADATAATATAKDAGTMGDGGAAAALVGLVVPPYPDGLEELTGTCVPQSDAQEDICSHGIGVLGRASADPARNARPEFVVANRGLGRDGQRARWRVTDALPHPPADGDAWVQAGGCRVDGADDPRVVALVVDDPDAEHLRATWARRLDLASGRFADLDPATVDCLNEAYGL